MSNIKAWHFTGSTLRDGSPIPADGEWIEHDDEIEMCKSGFHASKNIMDALSYAPGSTICRVQVAGEIILGNDKLVASKRKILWRVDGEEILFKASRLFALDVAHLWDMPPVVREFLETGNQKLRAASNAASWAASNAASWAASNAASNAAFWAASNAASKKKQDKILRRLIRDTRS